MLSIVTMDLPKLRPQVKSHRKLKRKMPESPLHIRKLSKLLRATLTRSSSRRRRKTRL